MTTNSIPMASYANDYVSIAVEKSVQTAREDSKRFEDTLDESLEEHKPIVNQEEKIKEDAPSENEDAQESIPGIFQLSNGITPTKQENIIKDEVLQNSSSANIQGNAIVSEGCIVTIDESVFKISTKDGIEKPLHSLLNIEQSQSEKLNTTIDQKINNGQTLLDYAQGEGTQNSNITNLANKVETDQIFLDLLNIKQSKPEKLNTTIDQKINNGQILFDNTQVEGFQNRNITNLTSGTGEKFSTFNLSALNIDSSLISRIIIKPEKSDTTEKSAQENSVQTLSDIDKSANIGTVKNIEMKNGEKEEKNTNLNSNKSQGESPEKEIIQLNKIETAIVDKTESKTIFSTKTDNINKTNNIYSIRLKEFTDTTSSLAKSLSGNGTYSARILLKPPSLGTVFVKITMSENYARLNIIADSSEAAKSIESQLGALRDKLFQQGIRTESININTRNNDYNMSGSGYYQQGSQQNYRDREALKEFIRTFKYLNSIEQEPDNSVVNSIDLKEQEPSIEAYV